MTRRTISSLAIKGGLVGGPFGSSLVGSDYAATGVPVIRGGNLNYGRFISGEFVYVSDEKFARDLSRNSAAPGDIIYTQRGTLGQVSIVPAGLAARFVISQSQMRLRVNTDVAVPEYVYYASTSNDFLQQVGDRVISTGVPHINLGILSQLEIPLPPLPMQSAIAEVLGALDDKIAANTSVAETAWSLVETEFRHLMKTGKSETTNLGAIADFEYGKPLPSTSRLPGSVAVVGSGGVVGSHSTSLVDRSGVVVGRKGSAGSVHWIHGPHYPIDTTFYIVGREDRISQPYLYFLLRSLRLDEMNNDSAVPGLNRPQALALRVNVPGRDLIERFTLKADCLVAVAEQSNDQNRTLAATRDALLPQLMSGKLRVRDAEAIAADAGA